MKNWTSFYPLAIFMSLVPLAYFAEGESDRNHHPEEDRLKQISKNSNPFKNQTLVSSTSQASPSTQSPKMGDIISRAPRSISLLANLSMQSSTSEREAKLQMIQALRAAAHGNVTAADRFQLRANIAMENANAVRIKIRQLQQATSPGMI